MTQQCIDQILANLLRATSGREADAAWLRRVSGNNASAWVKAQLVRLDKLGHKIEGV